jgi:hypothetical protein
MIEVTEMDGSHATYHHWHDMPNRRAKKAAYQQYGKIGFEFELHPDCCDARLLHYGEDSYRRMMARDLARMADEGPHGRNT